MNSIIKLSFGTAMGALLSLSVATAAEKWTAVTIQPSAKAINVPMLESMFAEIKDKTADELSIELKLSSQLPIAASTYTQAVGDGVVQIADDGYAVGNIPVLGLLKLPMLIQSIEEAQKVAAIALPAINETYEKQGAMALGIYFLPSQVPFSREEFNKLADFQGKKVETDSPQQEHFVKTFGGAGLVVSPADVPTSIQRGSLDIVITASAGGGKIWGDMLKSSYRLSVSEFPVVFAVNKEAFEKLAPEHQSLVRDVVVKHLPDLTKAFQVDEVKVTNALKEKGMQIIEPSAEDKAAATERMTPYWDEWANGQGADAQALLKQVRVELGR